MSAVLVFGSKAGGEVIMLRSHVEPLFQAIGRPLHDQGAILGEDLPSVISKVELALADNSLIETPPSDSAKEDEVEQEEQKKVLVSMRTRFYPLLDLMRKASENQGALHWRPL